MVLKKFSVLGSNDFVKFVICDRKDYEQTKKVMPLLRREHCWARFALSPVMPGLDPKELIKWAQEDGLTSCIINIQLHKLLDLKEDQDGGF